MGQGATLHARSVVFGEGLGAHGFRSVVIEGGRVEGRGRNWVHESDGPRANDYVFDGGGSVRIEDGDSYGFYYLLDNRGRIVLTGFGLDKGGVYCAGNDREPVVRGISASRPGCWTGSARGCAASVTPTSDPPA
jgi:hypothetical protein